MRFQIKCGRGRVNDFFVLLLIVGVVGFYCWILSTNGEFYKKDYYQMLGRSFLNGQLSLETLPKPELLALPDPYDPVANEKLALHDASLYQGKYYLYFGPTPAATLFAPFRALTGRDFSEGLSVVVFCSIGFIFSALLFRSIIRDYYPQLPESFLLLGVLSLGMANTIPFMLRLPEVYEVAISCGYCFLQITFFSFYRAARNTQQTLAWLMVASLSLGLAVGARWNYVLIVPVYILVAGGWLWRQRQSESSLVMRALLVFAPIALIGLSLAWYNWQRFGNPLEIGLRYQLTLGYEMYKERPVQLGNIPYNFYYYFLLIPKIGTLFPFIFAEAPQGIVLPSGYLGIENAAGFFLISPVSLFILGLPLLRKKGGPLVATLLFMMGAAFATVWSVLIISVTMMRYYVDFVPMLVFTGGVVICHLVCLSQDAKYVRIASRCLLAVILSIGCWSGFFLSFTGRYCLLKWFNPEVYQSMEAVFKPVEKVFKLPGKAASFLHRRDGQ